MFRERLIELDGLVREARASVIAANAEQADVDLLEGILALTASEDQYDRLCDEAGLDAHTEDAFAVLRTVMHGLAARLVSDDADERAFASYATLVMARATAENAEQRIEGLGVLAERALGENPFAT